VAPVSDVVRVEASAKKAAQKATERAQALAHRIAEKEARGQQRKAERAERLQAKGNSASAREAQRAAHREAVLEARRLQSQAAKLYPMDDQELLAVRGHTSGEERPLQAAAMMRVLALVLQFVGDLRAARPLPLAFACRILSNLCMCVDVSYAQGATSAREI